MPDRWRRGGAGGSGRRAGPAPGVAIMVTYVLFADVVQIGALAAITDSPGQRKLMLRTNG